MLKYKSEFIQFMMDCDVLTFGDFTLKSGRKSPYFINTGKYRTGAQLDRLGTYYADCFMKNVELSGNTLLFGPAYKGIPLATAAACALHRNYSIDLGYFFNRKEEKDHGEGGSFVGSSPKDGDRVVIIEDVITAGTAVREVVPILRASADIKLEDMIISVDRMERNQSGRTAVEEVYNEFGISIHPIVTVKEIRDYVDGKIDSALVAKMDEYISAHCNI